MSKKLFENLFKNQYVRIAVFGLLAIALAFSSMSAQPAYAAPITVNTTLTNAHTFMVSGESFATSFYAQNAVVISMPVVNVKDLKVKIRTNNVTGQWVNYAFPAETGYTTLTVSPFTSGTDATATFTIPASVHVAQVSIFVTPKTGLKAGDQYGFLVKPGSSVIKIEGFQRQNEKVGTNVSTGGSLLLMPTTATGFSFNKISGSTVTMTLTWTHLRDYAVSLTCADSGAITTCSLPDGSSVATFGGRAAVIRFSVSSTAATLGWTKTP